MAYKQKEVLTFKNPFQIIYQTIRATRPLHWIKNLSVFAALIFSGNLFTREPFLKTSLAFLSFSLGASAIYIVNDIADIQQDKLHPLKKMRPIASGKLTISVAIWTAGVLALVALLIATKLPIHFLFLLIIYFLIQVFYSFGLKNIPIIDILIIASGFVLRVYAGAFVIDAHLSVWFLLCVVSLALFLAAGKRRAELGFLPKGHTRRTLTKYTKELLNSYVTMFANAAWMSWALFTFFESPQPTTPVWLLLAEISRTTTINKLLMITIPIVIFGIMRYQSLIFEDRSETPEKIFLTDKFLISASFLWLIIVIWIIYGGATTV